jgi:hypothetical protein
MNTDSPRPVAPSPVVTSTVVTSPVATSPVPDKPTLEGIEAKWMPRWAKERVVQV